MILGREFKNTYWEKESEKEMVLLSQDGCMWMSPSRSELIILHKMQLKLDQRLIIKQDTLNLSEEKVRDSLKLI